MAILDPIGDNKFKVSLGSTTIDSFESLFETNNDIEEFDIWLEIKGDEEIQKLKKLFQLKGSNVKKLFWSNWSKHPLSITEVTEMLNCLSNVESIKFSSWYTECTGETAAGSLELSNLSNIEIDECKNFIFDFLSTALPENKIKCLKVNNVSEADAKLNSFIKKHSTIKRLNVAGSDFRTVDSVKDLKLEALRCIMYEREGETDNQRAFLKELIKSQSELTNLDVLNDMDYSFSFVDDSVFAEICALSKLETLLISVDGLSVNGIKSISSLTSLKNVELKTNRDSSLPIFNEFASLKNSSLERLVLKMWSFDIPVETYTAIGANYENLKSLKITLGTRHKLNFYAKTFPNLEELSIKFGESNNPVEFSQAFDAQDGIKQSKLKTLHLSFWGSETIDASSFLKFLQAFENLESLDLHTRFPFTADFVNQLAGNLNKIKALKITNFAVSNNETFSAEIIDAFKELRSKLKYAYLLFTNLQHVDFGGGHPAGEQGEKRDFTFKPFIDALDGIYEAKECGFSNIRIHNNLILTAGSEE